MFEEREMGLTKKKYNTQSGNVLFLILIAVALFAALSYAVTQSTRSGGGSAGRETSLLNSASMTQYPAGLRTSLIRMVLNGTSVDNLEFNPPSDFANLSANNVGVFHPEGGGGVYQNAPGELMAGGNLGTWIFNAHWSIPDIGTVTAGDGNDIIAFLPGVTRDVCESINDRVNIDTSGCATAVGDIPDILTASDGGNITQFMDDSYSIPSSSEVLQGEGCTAFSGQPTGCFTDTDNANRHVFYSTLLER